MSEPLFYVKAGSNVIFHRPVETKTGVRLGFAVCKVCDGVDPADVCNLLNKAEPPCTTR